jgi:hypothetical protein
VSPDPTDIRSFAVSVDDVVTAYETARDGKPAVLRVTPPFSGRMRARIHLAWEDDASETIHIDPRMLIDDDSPAYPTPEETEDRLRASEREYSVEVHHALHVEAVQEWREAVRSHIVSGVTIETPDGPHTVEVKPLG